jgi:hypothetical protein
MTTPKLAKPKTSQLVMAGLVPAISLRNEQSCLMIEIAGTSPAMTNAEADQIANGMLIFFGTAAFRNFT